MRVASSNTDCSAQSLTGQNYPYVQYGKPTEATYKFAEKVLVDRLERLYGVRSALPPVYMIGGELHHA